MDRMTLVAVAAVAGVALLGLLMRRGSVSEAGSVEAAGAPPEPEPPVVGDDEPDEAGADPHEVVAVTSEGWAFVPDGDSVQLVPPGEPEDLVPERATTQTGLSPTADPESQVMQGYGAPTDPKTRQRVPSWKPGEHLDPGDLVAARVVRGTEDDGPWRLEALGRDQDLRLWRFEGEDAASAALGLIARRVVRAPRGEDGEPRAYGEDEFRAARQEHEATERELATLSEEDLAGGDETG